MESLFEGLRRRQRRISGRKSTRELWDFGQYQVLFLAESEGELLQQICQVPLAEYQARRLRLAEAKAPRQLLHRLHRDPLGTMRRLVDQHAARRAALASSTGLPPPGSDNKTVGAANHYMQGVSARLFVRQHGAFSHSRVPTV